MDCVLLMRSEFSEDSLKRIQAHMLQNKDMIARRQRLLEEKNYSLKSWIGRCLMTNKPQDELKEYQLFAHCRGHQMLFNSMPYMLSAEAMDVMSSLLSDKTLGEMNRFMDDNFGLPPELKKQLKDRPVSFI
jgi:hypothetical protein